MDKINEFFKDLKQRLSSPLISSFIISWLIVNWKVVVALFKFELKGNTLTEYQSFIDYISSFLTAKDSFWIPLGVASFYSLIYPFIRNGLQILDAWFKAWGNDYQLRASKSNKVSIEKYIQLRETYKKRSDTLEEVLENESKTIQKNEELVNMNSELRNKHNILEREATERNETIQNLRNELLRQNNEIETYKIQMSKYRSKEEDASSKNRVEFLNGVWLRVYHQHQYPPIEKKIRFLDGTSFLVDEDGVETPEFTIASYDYNSINNNVTITTNMTANATTVSFILVPNDEFTEMKGKMIHPSYYKASFKRLS